MVIAFADRDIDIIASAAAGRGGDIVITAEVLGIEERPQNLFTNDIDASSEFGLDSDVAFGNRDINVIRKATELPSDPIEPQQNTVEACSGNGITA